MSQPLPNALILPVFYATIWDHFSTKVDRKKQIPREKQIHPYLPTVTLASYGSDRIMIAYLQSDLQSHKLFLF